MTQENFETLIWLLAIVALHVASGMTWGLVGVLFTFGGFFIFWSALKAVVR